MIKTYYSLTKPGIIYGNALSAIGGFFLASKGHINYGLFLAMLIGIYLIMASGCVFNNYIDRDIDKQMERTKKRASVTGLISGPQMLIFATILGLVGSLSLGLFTNLLTLGTALFGLFAYVVWYGIEKRRSLHGTEVGSISGAIPPVVGYLAVTNHLDVGAILLFLALVFWQMPHFYAIAIYRSKEYAAAKIPVLPLKKGVAASKVYILAYIIAFTVASGLLTVFGYTGYRYLFVMLILNFLWLYKGIQGFTTPDDNAWARKLFHFSLIILTAFCLLISFNALLP